MAHSRSLWVAPSPCFGSAMTRNATLSTVLSRTTTIRLTTSTPRMVHRRGWPVWAMGGAESTGTPRIDTEQCRIRGLRYSPSSPIRDRSVNKYCDPAYRAWREYGAAAVGGQSQLLAEPLLAQLRDDPGHRLEVGILVQDDELELDSGRHDQMIADGQALVLAVLRQITLDRGDDRP